MAKKHLFSFVFVLFLSENVSAQTTLRCRIVDEQVRGIPYATVIDSKRKNALCADSTGAFLCSRFTLVDSLVVSSLGYYPRMIAANKMSDTLVLQEKVFDIAEVKIIPQKGTLSDWQGGSKGPFVLGLSPSLAENLQIGLRIYPEKTGITKIEKVRFFIHKIGKSDAPFRLRIYNFRDGKPFRDMIEKSIILRGKPSGGWIEIPLTDLDIHIEKEGILLTMEWLRTGAEDTSFFKFKQDSTKNRFGQYLGYSSKDNNTSEFWSFRLSHNWTKVDKQFSIQVKTKHYP